VSPADLQDLRPVVGAVMRLRGKTVKDVTPQIELRFD
jgi:hypothetical protein